MQKCNRSKVTSIQLDLLCNEKDFKFFGHEAVFHPLISEIKDMEYNGIKINNFTRKGAVVFIADGNLGSHNIGAFTENFSHAYICRFCDATYDSLQNTATPNASSRIVSTYNLALKKLNESHDIKSYNLQFNSLCFFHVYQGCHHV
ncbi:hypothetical protein AVEN_275528-1 [Araneus ventricosus]|uniref:Uncharacterized protein n=1 Tax=Araneus ventricosus TaxID=182803 RepID=A0A4Y2RZ25_ARAVE|nr:hypothetical protein AVEN_275528-1 [Araneus ventricosus]